MHFLHSESATDLGHSAFKSQNVKKSLTLRKRFTNTNQRCGNHNISSNMKDPTFDHDIC